MLKSFLEFLWTGIVVCSAYGFYLFFMALATFIVGLPIGIGIYLINDAVSALFSGV